MMEIGVTAHFIYLIRVLSKRAVQYTEEGWAEASDLGGLGFVLKCVKAP